jgi:glycolate oxidase iron-sulfur subunit
MLFMGCTSPWCDQPTLLASLFVLRKLGYDVFIPEQQTCCGAMALHSGRLKKALSLAQQNERAFSGNIAHIITVATGCSATLQEVDEPFQHKVIDIIDFIESQEWPTDLRLKALPLQVKLHTPCSRRHVLKTTDTPKTMLAHIPGMAVSLFQTSTCCGAAGTYMVEHPDMAASLVKPLLAELALALPDFIATSNVGCALHLQRELKKQNLAITVGHPVMLLARALDF